MPHFFLLLFKINLVLILFSATYYLILRKLTFYSINRAFLVFGIIFSSAYPFIDLTSFFSGKPAVPAFIPQFSQNVKEFVQQDSVSVFWQILTIIFYAGVLGMAIRLMVQFISLRNMHKKSIAGAADNFKIRILSDRVSPFSFWQTIYINPGLHKPEDLQNIIEHEKVHVEEWHTLDIILAEICVVFYWFNPGVWLMKKAVRENIEFITDAKILKKGVDRRAYQYSLLTVGTLQPSVAIVNNFNLSDLKKRIKMMNAKRSSKVNLSRYLLALPILLVVTLAFTVDHKNVVKTIAPFTDMVKIELSEIKPELVINKAVKTSTKVKAKKTGAQSKMADSVKKVTVFFKTDIETTDTTRQSITNGLNKLVGKVIAMSTNDGIPRKNIVHSYSFTFNDSLKTDAAMVGLFAEGVNAKESAKPVKGTIHKVVLIRASTTKPNDRNGEGMITDPGNEVNYYINGQKVSNEDFKALDANKIAGIEVMKGSTGGIHITTKP